MRLRAMRRQSTTLQTPIGGLIEPFAFGAPPPVSRASSSLQPPSISSPVDSSLAPLALLRFKRILRWRRNDTPSCIAAERGSGSETASSAATQTPFGIASATPTGISTGTPSETPSGIAVNTIPEGVSPAIPEGVSAVIPEGVSVTIPELGSFSALLELSSLRRQPFSLADALATSSWAVAASLTTAPYRSSTTTAASASTSASSTSLQETTPPRRSSTVTAAGASPSDSSSLQENTPPTAPRRSSTTTAASASTSASVSSVPLSENQPRNRVSFGLIPRQISRPIAPLLGGCLVDYWPPLATEIALATEIGSSAEIESATQTDESTGIGLSAEIESATQIDESTGIGSSTEIESATQTDESTGVRVAPPANQMNSSTGVGGTEIEASNGLKVTPLPPLETEPGTGFEFTALAPPEVGTVTPTAAAAVASTVAATALATTLATTDTPNTAAAAAAVATTVAAAIADTADTPNAAAAAAAATATALVATASTLGNLAARERDAGPQAARGVSQESQEYAPAGQAREGSFSRERGTEMLLGDGGSITNLPLMGLLQVSLYKILFYLEAFLWESIILLLPPPTCNAYPIIILSHAHCSIYAPPPTPPFLCHTPYNIGDGNIV